MICGLGSVERLAHPNKRLCIFAISDLAYIFDLDIIISILPPLGNNRILQIPYSPESTMSSTCANGPQAFIASSTVLFCAPSSTNSDRSNRCML